ncbi:MAG TPA: twin-arginine translocase TatA/TatE family subunit [bacterium]|nr:twin-arginine translocase TatA/TatE family subunit [bacterium]
MFNMGPGELIVILIILLLLFGAKRLPEIGRAMGKSLGEFKKGMSESKEEANNIDDDEGRKKNGKE